jgi:hypothetical protein
MVEVGVGYYYGINRSRIYRKPIPVQQAEVFSALKETTVEQQGEIINLQEVFGAGYFSSCSKEFYAYVHVAGILFVVLKSANNL